MARETNAGARPKQLKASNGSTFIRTRELSKIQTAFDLVHFCLVASPPLSGRTTLLKQVAQLLQQENSQLRVLQIEVRTVTEFPAFLNSLQRLLALKDEELQLNHLIERLNDTETLLIIDNLDLVEGYEFFIDECLSKNSGAKILASVSDTPKIDPLKAIELRVIKDLRFSSLELEQWIAQVQLKIEPPVTTETILQRTQGYASVIRAVFSRALLDERALRMTDLYEGIPQICGHVIQRIKQQEVDILRDVAFVFCSCDMQDLFLRRLSASTLETLDAFGLIKISPNKQYQIADELRSHIKSSCSRQEAERSRSKILSELNSAQRPTLESREESVRQLISLEKTDEAAKILNTLVFDLSRDWRGDTILELTESTWRHISPEAYLIRRSYFYAYRAKFMFNPEQKVQAELSELIASTENPADRAYYLQIAARNSFTQGQLAQALEYARESVKIAPGGSEAQLWAKLTEAKMLSFEKSSWAYEAIRSTKESALEPRYSSLLRGFIYYELSMVCFHTSRYEEAIACDNLAYENFMACGLMPLIQVVRANRCYHLWGAGKFKSAVPELTALIENTQALGADKQRRNYVETLVSYYLEQGFLSRAKELWFAHNSDLLPIGKDGLLHMESLVHYFWIQLTEGASFEISESIRKIFGLSPEFSESGKFTLQALRHILESSTLRLPPPDLETMIRAKTLGDANDRVRTMALLLEHIWNTSITINAPQYISLLDSTLEESGAVPDRIRSKTLLALICIFDTNENNPKEIFESSLNYCKDNDIWLGQLRCHLGRALLELRQNQFTQAMAHLNFCTPLMEKIDHCVESDWVSALVGVCEALDQGPERLMEARNKLDRESAAADFLKACIDGNANSGTQSWWGPLVSLYLSSVRSVLCKTPQRKDLVQGVLQFDPKTRLLSVNGTSMDLSDRQIICAMLELFLNSSGIYFSKEDLVKKVWNESYNPLVHDTRIYTNIRRLRGLVEPLLGHAFIATRDGMYGYCPENQ